MKYTTAGSDRGNNAVRRNWIGCVFDLVQAINISESIKTGRDYLPVFSFKFTYFAGDLGG